eukprot:TRINITY_DN43447_c0_g1_i1.p2 TRINITY_DN43447_c0_g1~~TRINITY_DN43447_c0_g1_i1.p2  ORF type:complete len:216 (+),score=43.26 TRINITY_DN43447_c0_g1_i1:226-873(+)
MNFSPSAERNKQPIVEVLARFRPFSSPDRPARVLEIGSGTGQHVSHFATAFSHVTFQPTEYGGGSASPESQEHVDLQAVFASIGSWCEQLPNVEPAIELDCANDWPVAEESLDAITMCNVLHISPFFVSEGLLEGAAKALAPGAGLFVYGPFMVDGQHTAPSNEAFDARLRSQNEEWGIRDCTLLAEMAQAHKLTLQERVPMPANNFLLVFTKAN